MSQEKQSQLINQYCIDKCFNLSKSKIKIKYSLNYIAETIPTLIEYKSAVSAVGGEGEIEPDQKGLLKFLKKSQSLDFTEFSQPEIGLITEIEID
jgi:hypothetical protein